MVPVALPLTRMADTVRVFLFSFNFFVDLIASIIYTLIINQMVD